MIPPRWPFPGDARARLWAALAEDEGIVSGVPGVTLGYLAFRSGMPFGEVLAAIRTAGSRVRILDLPYRKAGPEARIFLYSRQKRGEERDGWVSMAVDEGVKDLARKDRARRDQRYENHFREEPEDVRWLGMVGKLLLARWLTDRRVRFDWIHKTGYNMPDLQIHGEPGMATVTVKTVKRQGRIDPAYTAGLSARHAREEVSHFFFCSYDVPADAIWLLGGITKEGFLEGARYYAAGEEVHKSYTIREGHEIYNIPIGQLLPPVAWLTSLLELPPDPEP